LEKTFTIKGIAAETVISQAQQQRMMLDKRLNEVTKATLNGETELFQDIFAKDPECALRMIKECDVK